MTFAVRDQRDRLRSFVPAFRTAPLSYADAATLPERRTVLTVPLAAPLTDLSACRLEFFFDYDVFPASIVSAFGEWRLEGRAMRTGDVIVQQASVPPWPVSLKLICAVRVLSVSQAPTQVSFSYGTLQGHVEMGEATFMLRLQDARLSAEIHTRSQPAQLPARLVAPVLVNPYQAYCTRRALTHMCQAFVRANGGIAGGPHRRA